MNDLTTRTDNQILAELDLAHKSRNQAETTTELDNAKLWHNSLMREIVRRNGIRTT